MDPAVLDAPRFTQRASPSVGATCSVEALDAFPGQASDAALLDGHGEELDAGLRGLAADGAVSVTLLVPDDSDVATITRLFSRVRVRPLPRLHPLDDLRVLRTWLGLPPGAPLLRASDVASAGRERMGRAAVDRWVSVAGSVHEPTTWRVPVGTPLGVLAELCGGRTHPRTVPFRTRPLEADSLHASVRPDDALIVFLPHDHFLARNDAMPLGHAIRRITAGCSRCGLCEEICPVSPSGPDAARLADALRWTTDGSGPVPSSDVANCLGCRLCETVCPAELPIGRIAHEIGRRVSTARASDDLRGLRLVPRDAFARRLSIVADATRREDGRDRISRVRFALHQRSGQRVEIVARDGARVWAGEVVAHVPGTRSRIVAPFTGRLRTGKDHLTIRRDA
jgi:ferredoxin